MRRFLVLSFLVALTVGAASGKTINAELPPFNQVFSCIPLAASVRPTSDKDKFDYSIYIKAEPHVVNALQYEVKDDVLYLSLTGDLTVNDPSHVTAILPADKLEALENHGVGTILVESGFETESMTLKSSAGSVRADDVSLDRLSIQTSAASTVFVEGTIQKANIEADGFSKAVTKGIQDSATVVVGAQSKVYITGSPEKDISGSAQFFGEVYADESASCTLSSTFFATGCANIQTVVVPSVEHKWTSDTQFSGVATCSAEKGYQVSTTTVTSKPGFGEETVSSVTTVGPGGHGTVITREGTSVVGAKTAAAARAHAEGEGGSYTAVTVSSASAVHAGSPSVSPAPARRLLPKPVLVI